MAYVQTAITNFSAIPFNKWPAQGNYIYGFDTDTQLKKMDYQGVITVIGGRGGVTTFIALTDTPNSYAGQNRKFVKVKEDSTGLEFYTLFQTDWSFVSPGDVIVSSDLVVQGGSLFQQDVVFDSTTQWYNVPNDQVAAIQGYSLLENDLFTGIKQGDFYLNLPNSEITPSYYGPASYGQSYWISAGNPAVPLVQVNTEITKVYNTLVLSDSTYGELGALRFDSNKLQVYNNTGWANVGAGVAGAVGSIQFNNAGTQDGFGLFNPSFISLTLDASSTIDNGFYSVILGGYNCSITTSQFSFIGAGASNSTAFSNYSFVGAGLNNYNSNSSFSFVGGGESNYNSNNSDYAFVGGGFNNSNTLSSYSFVGAGCYNYNNNNSNYAFVGAGLNNYNTLSSYSFVGGGDSNYNIDSLNAVVLGGVISSNSASNYSVVSGNNNTNVASPNSLVLAGSVSSNSGVSNSALIACSNYTNNTTSNVLIVPRLVVYSNDNTNPLPGMLYFDGTHFQGYNGSTWVQLDN